MDPRDPILAGLTPPQAEAAMHDGAILVLAGAGTGKTRTLTSAVAWRIGFIDDIPEQHRVTGWLRAQVEPGFVGQSGSRFADDLDAMELLRQF